MARIDIVLATYDGERFLGAQIDSIIAQTHSDWHLIVRDDGSSDNSTEIIEHYRQVFPHRLTVLDDDDGTLGHAQNFARMLGASTARYVAFCDQDDVWLPDKLQKSLDALQQLERRAGPGTPSLVFSDSVVVDADLHTVERSFWTMENIHPEDAGQLGKMLYRNVVAANTTMINAALRELALPVPPGTPFVDWWIATLASAVGASAYLETPRVLYRQHGGNVNGARPFRQPSWSSGVDLVRNRKSWQAATVHRFEQAEALSSRVATTIDARMLQTLEAFLALPGLTVAGRWKQAKRHDLLPRGFVRGIIFICSAGSWRSASSAK